MRLVCVTSEIDALQLSAVSQSTRHLGCAFVANVVICRSFVSVLLTPGRLHACVRVWSPHSSGRCIGEPHSAARRWLAAWHLRKISAFALLQYSSTMQRWRGCSQDTLQRKENLAHLAGCDNARLVEYGSACNIPDAPLRLRPLDTDLLGVPHSTSSSKCGSTIGSESITTCATASMIASLQSGE